MKIVIWIIGFLGVSCGSADMRVSDSTHRIVIEIALCSEKNFPDLAERKQCITDLIDVLD